MQQTKNETASVDAGTENTTGHTEAQDDAVSPDQLVEMLLDQTDQPEGNPGPEDGLGEPEEESAQTAEADLDLLTEEQLEQLAEQMNSRGAERIAQLIRERKQLQSQLDQLSEKENPLEEEPSAESNPFNEIDSTDDLRKKYSEVSEMVEWASELLDDHDDEHRDTVIHEEDGQEFTKGQIRKLLRSARKAKDQHLPARFEQLQQKEELFATRAQYRNIVEEEFEWAKQEDNPIRQRFESVLNSEELQNLSESMPELPLILAHAADSIARSEARKKGDTQHAQPTPQAPASQRMRPPSNPSGSTAAPAQGNSKPAQRLAALQAQFESTGDHHVLSEILEIQNS
tara:strand:+ start:6400 stop:7428 length:1029 start_codon:yes stop_codon:yes gene_type:complete